MQLDERDQLINSLPRKERIEKRTLILFIDRSIESITSKVEPLADIIFSNESQINEVHLVYFHKSMSVTVVNNKGDFIKSARNESSFVLGLGGTANFKNCIGYVTQLLDSHF